MRLSRRSILGGLLAPLGTAYQTKLGLGGSFDVLGPTGPVGQHGIPVIAHSKASLGFIITRRQIEEGLTRDLLVDFPELSISAFPDVNMDIYEVSGPGDVVWNAWRRLAERDKLSESAPTFLSVRPSVRPRGGAKVRPEDQGDTRCPEV